MNNSRSRMHIGKGSYGSVFVSQKCEKHAVKLFENKDFRFYVRELWFLSLLKDVPNFCQLVSYEMDKLEFTMIRYDTNLHSLANELTYYDRYKITDSIIYQMNDALSFLHNRGISHNDISMSNIFCNYDKHKRDIKCYLGDFSLTSVNDDYKSHDNPTYLYFDIDPEATNMESDVWSLGITIFYFLSKCILWDDISFVLEEQDFIDYHSLYPDFKIANFTYDTLCDFLNFKGINRPRADTIYNIASKFDKIKNKINKSNKNKTRRKAIKFMKNVTVDRCLVDTPNNEYFVEYFSPIDITNFVKRNF